VSEFEQFLRQIGATNIKIVNKEISYRYVQRSRTTTKSRYVVRARFVYDGLWFYVNGNDDAQNPCFYTTYSIGSRQETSVYSQKNEYNEEYVDESYWARDIHEGYIM
jgi:hypothetical protein